MCVCVCACACRSRQKSEKCRKFYQQAVNSVTDDPRHVCEAYLQYEREEGSLESYEAAVKRTRAQLDRIKDREDTVRGEGGNLIVQCTPYLHLIRTPRS